MSWTKSPKHPKQKTRGQIVRELLRDGVRCNRSSLLWEGFLKFHDKNPWVYDRLKQICFDLRSRGWDQYSMSTIISVLRFEWDLKTGGVALYAKDEEPEIVKLSNNHSPYYARILIEDEPIYWDFFELRSVEGDPPSDTQPEIHKHDDLLSRLRKIKQPWA